ncbi:hypothetical protein DBR32_08245 [Taibaiella sp. KBW10]|nr:hypothetical protein DBR32_08245 [Taibaiella sp. KBW10]
MLTFGAGIQGLYSIDDHWQLGISFQYSKEQYEGNIYLRNTHQNPMYYWQHESASFLWMPVQVRYNFRQAKHKIRPYIYLAGTPRYYLNYNNRILDVAPLDAYTTHVFSVADIGFSGYRKFDIGITTGVGLIYSI